MNILAKVKEKVFLKYLQKLSVDRIMKITKKHIINSAYTPICIMYHRVNDNFSNEITVSTNTMEQHIEFFKKYGFRFLFEEEYFSSDDFSVILTFDDGYLDNYENLYPLLKKHNAKASINLIARHSVDPREVSYMHEKEILELAQSGYISFQSHSYSHRKLENCTHDELLTEIKHSKEFLEKNFNLNISVMVTPYLQNSKVISNIAKKYYNLVYSSSLKDVDQRYCISRISSSERKTTKDFAISICLKARQNAKKHKENNRN